MDVEDIMLIEISRTNTMSSTYVCHLKKPKIIDPENRLVVATGGDGGWGKLREEGQKVQMSMWESWGCDVQHVD